MVTAKNEATYTVLIYIAGDIADARRVIRDECWYEGLCVTVTPTTFIYTGGEEVGVIVGFVNYPRFPKTPEDINVRARLLAERLMGALYQRTCLIVMPAETHWLSRVPPGVKE